MKAAVYNLAGERVRDADLPAGIFGIQPNQGVMHQYLVRQMANARRGTAQTQTRSEVDRTGKKWYRQKGTGRARHGARSAPIFVGGGVAHGPRQRKYTKKMPKKMRHLALRSALSVKAAEDAVALVEGLEMDGPKTRAIKTLVDQACDGASTLIVLAGRNEAVEQSSRNLDNVRTLHAGYLNMRDLLGFDRVLIEADALDGIVTMLTDAKRRGNGENDASI